MRCQGDPINPWVTATELGGEDGLGIEQIHALLARDATIPTGNYPPNTLIYDAPLDATTGADVGVRIENGLVVGTGGTLYFDNPQPTQLLPRLGTFTRRVPGMPDRGTAPDSDWGDWVGPRYTTPIAVDGRAGTDGCLLYTSPSPRD